MLWIFLPSKRPTPSEYAVIVVLLSVVCIILGMVALVMGFRQPPQNHKLAVALEYRGAWCVGVGVIIAFLYWLYRQLKAY